MLNGGIPCGKTTLPMILQRISTNQRIVPQEALQMIVNFPAFLNNLNVCIHNLYAHFAIKVKYIVPISTVYISPSFLMRLSFAMLHGIVVLSIYTFVFLANFQILFCFKPKNLKLSKNAVINLVACSWLITKTFNYYGKNDSDKYSQNQ